MTSPDEIDEAEFVIGLAALGGVRLNEGELGGEFFTHACVAARDVRAAGIAVDRKWLDAAEWLYADEGWEDDPDAVEFFQNLRASVLQPAVV